MYRQYHRCGQDDSWSEKAVETDGMEIKYIPKSQITDQLREKAVLQNGMSLRFMEPTPRLSKLAVSQNGLSLQYVPLAIMNKDIILLAVTQNGSALQYVPQGFIDREILLSAVTQNGSALRFVPHDLQWDELISTAISGNPDAVQFCVQSRSACDLAVSKDSETIKFVNDEFKSPEMITGLILRPGIEKFVPISLRSKEFVNKLETMYAENAYEKVGSIRIYTKKQIQTNPPKYHVIEKDGSASWRHLTGYEQIQFKLSKAFNFR